MLLTNLKLITPSKCAASRFLPTLFMMSATGEKYATLFHSDLCRQSLKGLENKYSCFHIMHWPLDIFLFQTRIRKCNWILRRLISHLVHFSKGSAIKVHFSLLQKRKKIALICVIKCKKSDTCSLKWHWPRSVNTSDFGLQSRKKNKSEECELVKPSKLGSMHIFSSPFISDMQSIVIVNLHFDMQ